MPVYQKFNKRNKAWVKFKFTKEGTKFFDIKQRKPKIPFKNIKIIN